MKHIWLKGALVGAAVIFGANGSFAANDWTYADGKITKDGWSIAVTYTEGSNAITIGALEAESENHILDLRDMSVGATAITKLTWGGTHWKNSTVREFYVNHLVNTGIKNFFSNNQNSGCATIRSVEITSDTVTKLYQTSFSGCTNLVNLVLNCPKLTEYEKYFISKTILTNEANSIVKPWATILGEYTCSGWGSTKLCGSFILTNLTSKTKSAAFSGGSPSVTNMWIRWPAGVSHPTISGWAGVEKLKLELPTTCTNLHRGAWGEMKSLEMDIGDLVPAWISNVRDYSVYKWPKVYGRLVLTNLIVSANGNGKSQNVVFTGVPNVKAMTLMGPVEDFSGPFTDTALTNLVLKFPKLNNLGPATNQYNNLTAVFPLASGAEVTVLGAASGYTKGDVVGNWTTNLVDNLLFGVTKERAVTLYCSKKQGWKDLEGRKDLTDEEKEIAPEGCFGVWESAAGVRKAWMVHKAQAGDPTGLCIRVQ